MIFVLLGIALNIILSFVMNRLSLPLFLDTAGTIGVASVAGVFPGIIVALATNVFCLFFNDQSIYYSILNVLIAIVAAEFSRRGRFKKAGGITVFILLITLVGGLFGGLLQWALLGRPQFSALEETAGALVPDKGTLYFLVFLLLNAGLNLIDKSISAGIALCILKLLPPEIKKAIEDSVWRQKPLTEHDIAELKFQKKIGDNSLQTRLTVMLTIAAVTLTLVMGVISLRLYFENVKEEYTETAKSAAAFAADMIDPDKVDEYLLRGEQVEGYKETERILSDIRDNSPGVEYVYVIKIKQNACYFVFDLDTGDVEGYDPGERVEFEEAFLPYVPTLVKGEEIEPVISNDFFGWLLTAYKPVKNSLGETVCYAGADVSMNYLSDYVRDYLLRTFLIFSGVFILVLSYGFWVSRIYLVFPINSMAQVADSFAGDIENQGSFDESVNRLRSLDIQTGDEVEKLYRAICRMALNTSEQMRGVRYYADANEKMQNGLIITMANMVENRDSDTGAHIQKTAAYVRIILNGLRAKGYYPEKLTDKYMSDVEMSAPLHDVGKIHIPDAVLNKPGKLDAKEFEIMKTHTTAGKAILENAIGTVKGENYLKEARNMAAYHHERWDGKGYPEGLHGEVIPLSARVMAIADVFDALASPRIYKPAFPFEKAISIIKEGSGTQFDPKCVEVFLDSLSEVKKVLKRYHE